MIDTHDGETTGSYRESRAMKKSAQQAGGSDDAKAESSEQGDTETDEESQAG